MMSAAAFAEQVVAKLPQFSGGESLKRGPDSGEALGVVNLDSGLAHGGQGFHAHAAGQQDLYSGLGQLMDRLNASAVIMAFIGFNADALDGSVFNFSHSVGRAMPEMGAWRGVQAAGGVRGNSRHNDIAHGKLLIFCYFGNDISLFGFMPAKNQPDASRDKGKAEKLPHCDQAVGKIAYMGVGDADQLNRDAGQAVPDCEHA